MRDYEPYYTEDGSIGLYSYADKDVYHSKFGALTEAWEKFVIPSKIDKLLTNKADIKFLDICYGIGYNTKALVSYVIEINKNKIYKKNLFQKIRNFVSIDDNKKKSFPKENLSAYNATIDNDKAKLPLIQIDCLDINEELVKLSPLFKRLKTPGEVFDNFVPNFLTCFDTYYKIKNMYVNFASIFYPKNKKRIKELLDIKFKNMHIDKEYKVNPLANYILINRLSDLYHSEYYNKDLKKILKEKGISHFFDKSYIKYAKFNHIWGYSSTSNSLLSSFLHNIYYDRLSRRYNNIDFKAAERLFNINYHIKDARKAIKDLNCKYDCIFLDAFTYTKAPQLWSQEFIAELSNRLNDNGVLLTYSNSAQIRNTFLENNLYVGKIYNEKTKTYVGTIASKDKSKIEYPLNNYEIGLCNTKAGIPYHDPNLAFTNKEIMELREYEFRHSLLMSSSKYMKLRNMKGSEEDEYDI